MYHNNFYVHRDGFGRIVANEDSACYLFENQSPGNLTRNTANLGSSRRNATGVLPGLGGCFGYVVSGSALVHGLFSRAIDLNRGQFFTTAGNAEVQLVLSAPDTRIVVFQRLGGYAGMATVGQAEAEGRLGYIDGCKDTVLHGPLVKGLPCLNALFMPAGIHQTSHTHPSTRLGVIVAGGGICQTVTPENATGFQDAGHTYELKAGDVFFLPENGWHKFRTDFANSTGMNIVAYHPSSDFGPTNEEHPMLNLTMVMGVSAKDIPQIRTKIS